MDILNFISWIKGKRQFTTIDPAQSVLPVGVKDPKRDDNYLTGAVTVEDFADIVAGVIPPGPTGPQGIAGPAGVPGPVGPAGLNWQGTWVSGTSYVLDDAIGYSGASYYCILATSGTTAPNLDTTHWALLASQGAIGPQGPQGPAGAQGPSGNPIAWLEYDATYKSVWNNGYNNVGTNTSYGDQAIASNGASAAYNTGLGYMALRNNSNGQYNTAVGGTALVNNQGNFNTGIGYSAGYNTGTGANITAIGAFALQSTPASNNTGIGYEAGKNISSGVSNTVLGSGSALTLTTGAGNVIIGQGANAAAAATNYSVALGFNAAAATFSTVIGSSATSSTYTGSVVIGVGATATGNNQFVVGSNTQAAGAVTTETVSSSRTWTVVINGTTHKILLA